MCWVDMLLRLSLVGTIALTVIEVRVEREERVQNELDMIWVLWTRFRDLVWYSRDYVKLAECYWR